MAAEERQATDVLRAQARAYSCLFALADQHPSNIEPCRQLLWALSDIDIAARPHGADDLPVYDFNEYLLYLADMQRGKLDATQKRQAEAFRACVTEWIQRVGE